MLIQKCIICDKEFKIKRNEKKYIIENEDFACSPTCITKWIISAQDLLLNVIPYKLFKPISYTFRSDYERNIAVFLLSNNFKFQYEEFGFSIEKNTYTPDFYLPDYRCFLEVKGIWNTGGKNKIKLFRELYPGVRLLIIPWTLQNKFKKYK